jgi:hypothetical protein
MQQTRVKTYCQYKTMISIEAERKAKFWLTHTRNIYYLNNRDRFIQTLSFDEKPLDN